MSQNNGLLTSWYYALSQDGNDLPIRIMYRSGKKHRFGLSVTSIIRCFSKSDVRTNGRYENCITSERLVQAIRLLLCYEIPHTQVGVSLRTVIDTIPSNDEKTNISEFFLTFGEKRSRIRLRLRSR